MAENVTINRSLSRCGWGEGPDDYLIYHDSEWGLPQLIDNKPDDTVLFEKLCLEGFQSGLSWLTILRKRPAFREVFADFDAEIVAAYGENEVLKLLDDQRIIRHRGKITATINNAQAVLQLYADGGSLAELMWSHQPKTHSRRESMDQVPASTPESVALAKELKGLGFRFVGPTTAYAAMQAMGVVNDHLTSCFCYQDCQTAQNEATSAIKGLKN